MAGILKSCVYNGLSISQLLAFQNLSYKILKPSLDHLSSSNLIEYEIEKRRKYVRTTAQGLHALRAYETALALMDGRAPFVLMNGPPHPRPQLEQNSKRTAKEL
jgi:predicted transcriptional regulator